MIKQTEFTLKPRTRGFHLISNEIISQLPQLPKNGLLNLFVKHTSCGLCINENADPDVRTDMEGIFNHIVPEISHTFVIPLKEAMTCRPMQNLSYQA